MAVTGGEDHYGSVMIATIWVWVTGVINGLKAGPNLTVTIENKLCYFVLSLL